MKNKLLKLAIAIIIIVGSIVTVIFVARLIFLPYHDGGRTLIADFVIEKEDGEILYASNGGVNINYDGSLPERRTFFFGASRQEGSRSMIDNFQPSLKLVSSDSFSKYFNEKNGFNFSEDLIYRETEGRYDGNRRRDTVETYFEPTKASLIGKIDKVSFKNYGGKRRIEDLIVSFNGDIVDKKSQIRNIRGTFKLVITDRGRYIEF